MVYTICTLRKLWQITCIAITVFVATLSASAQGKFWGNSMDLNRATLLPEIPDIPVADNSGRQYQLTNYIRANELHKGKPYLIAGFGYFGNYSLDLLNDLSQKGLGAKYNVIVLCVGAKEDQMKNTVLTEKKYHEQWKNFLVVKTTWDAAKSMYFESWPFLIFADKNLKVVDTEGYNTPYYSNAATILEGIDKGKITPGTRWYTNTGMLTYKEDPAASFYTQYSRQGDKVWYTQGSKTRVTDKRGFVFKDGLYYYDGVWEAVDDKGQVMLSGTFKDGVVSGTATVKYSNGKIKWTIPVNGTTKMFDEEGNLVMEGIMANGLGNGKFTSFKNGLKTEELNYKNGELYGFQKFYSHGLLEKEYYALPEFEAHEYFSEDLQGVKVKGKWGYIDRTGKIVIPATFESAGEFDGGLASVKIGYDKYITINKQGKTIDENEAKRISAAHDAKNYQPHVIALKAINAMGGLDALNKISSVRMEGKGKIEYSENCNFTIEIKPGKGLWREMRFADYKVTEGISETDYWIRNDNEKPGTVSSDRIKIVKSQLSITTLADALDQGWALTYEGKGYMSGGINGLLISYERNGLKYRHTINPVTYFIAETFIWWPGDYDKKAITLKYDDYRKTSAGVFLPFKLDISDVLSYELQVSKMEFNQPVDANKFKRPN